MFTRIGSSNFSNAQLATVESNGLSTNTCASIYTSILRHRLWRHRDLSMSRQAIPPESHHQHTHLMQSIVPITTSDTAAAGPINGNSLYNYGRQLQSSRFHHQKFNCVGDVFGNLGAKVCCVLQVSALYQNPYLGIRCYITWTGCLILQASHCFYKLRNWHCGLKFL